MLQSDRVGTNGTMAASSFQKQHFKTHCFVISVFVGQGSPRYLKGDHEGHWASAFNSPFKMLNFEYDIDI